MLQHLPARYLRFYGEHGELEEISTASVDTTAEVDTTSLHQVDTTTTSHQVGTAASHLVDRAASHQVDTTTASSQVGTAASHQVDSTASRQVDTIASCQVGSIVSSPIKHVTSHLVDTTPSRPAASRLVDATKSQPVNSCPVNDSQSLPAVNSCSSIHNYKTTLGKTLSNVLQDSPDLRNFDKLRYLIKNSSVSAANNNRYKELCKLFQDKLIKKHNEKSHCYKKCKKILFQEWQLKL